VQVLRELSNIDGKTSSTDEVQTTQGTYPIHVAVGSSPHTRDENLLSALRLSFPNNDKLITKESLVALCWS
jgi:hypothetical protein